MASDMPAKARKRAIALAAEGGSLKKGAVLITTYGMVSSNPKQFAPVVGTAGGWIERGESQQHVWDYVILDEGHKIKNASTKWVPPPLPLAVCAPPTYMYSSWATLHGGRRRFWFLEAIFSCYFYDISLQLAPAADGRRIRHIILGHGDAMSCRVVSRHQWAVMNKLFRT